MFPTILDETSIGGSNRLIVGLSSLGTFYESTNGGGAGWRRVSN
jgi:hypothetical protein